MDRMEMVRSGHLLHVFRSWQLKMPLWVLGSRCSQREAPCVSVCNVTLFGCFYLPFSLVLDSLLMCLVVFFMFLVLGALDADFSGFVVVIKFEKFVHFFKYFFCPLSAFGGLQFTLRLQLELAPTAH